MIIISIHISWKFVADKEVAVKNEITGEMEYVEQSVDGYITTCEACGHQEECF